MDRGLAELMVHDQCMTDVRDQLKAPATAQFGDHQARPVGAVEGAWVETGVVDSQNSFGALVRAGYSCTATVEGEGVVVTGAVVLG